MLTEVTSVLWFVYDSGCISLFTDVAASEAEKQISAGRSGFSSKTKAFIAMKIRVAERRSCNGQEYSTSRHLLPERFAETLAH